ncbi:bifunctional phosphoserine phosphatase/homoserine phosphotransferase ThrH [Marinomonas sp. TI.3.20]|uniref:bifunctional phosphoserine phosphatase/homoserine phosphotransferase ThrH n=1 Tax=Marinomonas sp. TI.3.20 TaxID=3121296 RepID=UPI003120279A
MVEFNKELKKCFFVDMEGVLIPEMWPYISKKTGIKELEVTTREHDCYEELVENRIDILKINNITVFDLNEIVLDLDLLPGARDFIDTLSVKYEVVLVSDAFKPLINHFWQMLGRPNLQCHQFLLDSNGTITDALYSREGGKQSLLKKYQENGYEVFAVGDAFNDLEMLKEAKKGFLYQSSEDTKASAKDVLIVDSFKEILDEVAI